MPDTVKMKNKSKISGTAAKLMTQISEAGLTACCTSKNHLNVILFCHRHGLESPLKNRCASIPVTNYNVAPFLLLKSAIYGRIAGAPGANAVFEALNRPVQPAAVNAVIYLIDTKAIPQANSAIVRYSQHNILEKVPTHPEILARALKMLQLGSSASPELTQISSKNLLIRKQTSETFHYFKKLPPEIRLMIWKFGITGRAVELYHCKGRIKSACPTPVLLRVNKESRQVALKVFKPLGSGNAPGEVIFSYDLDTLYLSHRSCAFHDYEFIIKEMAKAKRWAGAFKQLKRVAIHKGTKSEHDKFIQHLSKFSKLEEITFIKDDNVIAFEQHETDLVEHDYNIRERQRFMKFMKSKFKLLDVHAETRAPNTPVFNTKLAKSYRVR